MRRTGVCDGRRPRDAEVPSGEPVRLIARRSLLIDDGATPHWARNGQPNEAHVPPGARRRRGRKAAHRGAHR
jgi:hypothetical protein